MTANSSRILTLEKRIPKMVVNNPDLVTVTALSANQVQLAALKPGVTQVNLWDEDGQIYTVDVLIYGDVRELELALKQSFPEASIKLMRLTNSLVLEGFVERPESVSPIIRLAEDYAPKIINNITVGGVQQVMLKVQVMEVSRTKLRRLSADFALTDGSDIIASSVSGLIQSVTPSAVTATGQTFAVGLVNQADTFHLFLDALQQNDMAKILANPTILAISGRPAKFIVGGEVPIPVPSGLGQVTLEYKEFGTKVDFVPIVLGNGNIRLEIRAEVSEVDVTRGITLNGINAPGFKTSYVDTGVEIKAGQTLVLAGLIQTRIDANESGLPFLSDLPYVGAAFRSVEEEVSEIELLIMVTPEFADGMEPHEVPQCGPGMESVSPTNCQLYWGGHLEVPASGPCGPGGMGACGRSGCTSCGTPAMATDAGLPVNAYPSQNDNFPSQIDNGEPVEGSLVPVKPENPSLLPVPSTDSDPAAKAGRAPWMQTRQPIPQNPQVRQYQMARQPGSQPTTSTPGLIGPLGYDVEK